MPVPVLSSGPDGSAKSDDAARSSLVAEVLDHTSEPTPPVFFSPFVILPETMTTRAQAPSLATAQLPHERLPGAPPSTSEQEPPTPSSAPLDHLDSPEDLSLEDLKEIHEYYKSKADKSALDNLIEEEKAVCEYRRSDAIGTTSSWGDP